jgi:hypothetical protein
MFIDEADGALSRGIEFDSHSFEETCKYWEKSWQHRRHRYPDQPVGDTYGVSMELFKKYVLKQDATQES